MSENLHNIDKLFRDGIDNHEDLPGENLWDGIDAALDKNNVVSIKRKYNNLKRVAAILLLMLVTVAAYEIFKPKPSGSEMAAEKNNTPANTSNKGAADNNNTANNTATQNSGDAKTVNNAALNNENTAANTTAANTVSGRDSKSVVPSEVTNSVNGSSNNTGIVKSNQPNGIKESSTTLPGNPTVDNNEANNKTTVTKTNRSRTKTTIKAPQQVTEEDDETLTGGNQTADAVTATDMAPLEKEKILSLAARINRAIAAENISLQRNAPDVAIAKSKTVKKFGFSIMPFYSAQFASNKIKAEKPAPPNGGGPGGPPPPRPGNNGHKEQFKKEEQSQTSYSTGIIAELPIGKNFGLQTGISYLQKTTTIEPKKIYARPDKDGKVKYVFDCTSGYSYIASKTGTAPSTGDSINVTDSKNTLGYIGVPVALSYKVALGKKLSIIPTAGAVFNFLTKQKIKTQLVQGSAKEQQTINNINGLSKNYINATAGLAVEYDINKRMALNIMPSGNFALSSINNSDAAIKSYPNAFAVSAGLKIKL